jgi:hypothetical protein
METSRSEEDMLQLMKEFDAKNGGQTLSVTQPPLTLEEADKAKIAFGGCYEDIISFLGSYMEMPEDYKKLTAIWILGTYLHKEYEVFPYLFINAMRGSGKTRLLRIISQLACNSNGQVHTGLTESVFFRTPKHFTLVIDEFEGVGGKQKSELREYLNASYKRGGVVKRMKKVTKDKETNYEPEIFEPFKPIAMANIWGMDEVLGDRCISFLLQKSDNPAKTKKIENFSDNSIIKDIKRTLEEVSCRLCMLVASKEYMEAWNTYIDYKYLHPTLLTLPTLPTLPTSNLERLQQEEMFLKMDDSGIEGRNFELLFPLLLTAKILNFETFEDILRVGKDIMAWKKQDEMAESKDVSVIEFVSQCPQSYQLDYKLQIDLKREFNIFIGGVDDSDDKWLTNEWFGRSLKRLDLILDKRRKTKGNEVTLNIPKAKEKLRMFKKEEIKDGTQ